MKETSPAGGPIEASVGTPFEIVVHGQPGGGYKWQPEVDEEQIQFVEHSTADRGAGIGAATEERFVFIPRSPGVSKVRLVLKRPWEQTPYEVRDFAVQAGQSLKPSADG